MTATAGAGWKDFAAGAALPASEVDGYLMAQTIMRFATTTARDAALTGSAAPTEGMHCFVDALDILYYYNGAAWVFKEGWGTGSPEAAVTATKGAVWHQTDGTPGGCTWVKESDTSNTGWARSSTIVQIAQTILSGDAANIDFTSIPATYRDLMITFSGRTDRAAVSDNCRVRFNNDSGATYNDEYVDVLNTTVAGGRDTGVTGFYAASLAGATAVANAVGGFTFHIPNYRATTFYKSAHSEGGYPTEGYLWNWCGLWHSTAAISRVTLYPDAGTVLKTGTVATLYGIGT